MGCLGSSEFPGTIQRLAVTSEGTRASPNLSDLAIPLPDLMIPGGFSGAILGEGLSGQGEKHIIWTFSLEDGI